MDPVVISGECLYLEVSALTKFGASLDSITCMITKMGRAAGAVRV